MATAAILDFTKMLITSVRIEPFGCNLNCIYTGPPLIHASLIHDFGLFAVPTLAPEFSGTDRQNDAKKPTTMAMMFRQQDIAQQRFS